MCLRCACLVSGLLAKKADRLVVMLASEERRRKACGKANIPFVRAGDGMNMVANLSLILTNANKLYY